MIAEDPEKTRTIDAQTSRLHDLIRARGPACPETRKRAAAILSASLASSGVALPPPPPDAPAPPPVVRRSESAQ